MTLPRRPLLPREGDAAPGSRGPGARPARVLVVDDSAQNRSVLERWLARRGHRVESAENGRIALEMTAAGSYDLVLLDLEMPELNGYETLRRLKESSATRDIPVIMISGLDELQGIARCIKAGAEDYLQKPFETVLLSARVDASLERKRLRDSEVEYMSQVARVIEAALALEAGGYQPGSLADVAVRPDELGRLARIFDAMATQVRAREERLRTRIDALRAEIVASPSGALFADDPAAAVTHRLASPSGAQALEAKPEPASQAHTILAERFEILSQIGSGGMGVVYRAHDRELDEVVAIKLLHPRLHWEDDRATERFKSEIRLARQISSPHVVRTHDFGEWKGVHYITMEFVAGVTLRELLERRGRLAPPAVLGIAAQLARALDVAHRQGIIHRDIKPENLLLDHAGVLKVMDFGIAQMAQHSQRATKAGMIVGTPDYMPPEQLVGDPVDQRTDLYAAGVVMYECLTGRRPIDAEDVFQLVARVLQEEPIPPRTMVPEIPAALSALVMRLLAKRREDRPSSAAELSELLASLG